MCTAFQQEKVFKTNVAKTSDPSKVAGSVIKALREGKYVETSATGSKAILVLTRTVALVQRFARESGGEVSVVFVLERLPEPPYEVVHARFQYRAVPQKYTSRCGSGWQQASSPR